jgi:protein-disulfide isomerase
MAIPSANRAKTTRRKEKPRSTSFGLWLIVGSILIVALGVAVVILNNRAETSALSSNIDLPAERIQGKTLGNPQATVTVQVWEDFLCPHCREWTTTIKPQLLEEYVKTDKIRLEFHLLPLQGFAPGSTMAGLAAECAADQNLFWPYHDQLFAAQGEGQAGYTLERLVERAKTVGLDESQFSQCLAGRQHQPALDASLKQATELGLDSTPSVLINGKRMAYPFDYPGLKAEIDSLLQG